MKLYKSCPQCGDEIKLSPNAPGTFDFSCPHCDTDLLAKVDTSLEKLTLELKQQAPKVKPSSNTSSKARPTKKPEAANKNSKVAIALTLVTLAIGAAVTTYYFNQSTVAEASPKVSPPTILKTQHSPGSIPSVAIDRSNKFQFENIA